MTNEFTSPVNGKLAEPHASTPSVSVIVPVYNAEPYLPECIESLIHQTMEDIEIILVDDGSTDRSGQICDEYAAKDPRIQVIHQKNAGISEARNAGIDCARADYFMFADSDDWVEPDFCHTPYILARENGADLVMFQYRQNKQGQDIRHYPAIPEGVKPPEEANHLLVSIVMMYAWNKLYHRDLFSDLRYPAGKVYEDRLMTPVLVHKASKIVYSSRILYHYQQRSDGISQTHSQNNLDDCFYAIEQTTQNMRNWGYTQDATEYYQFCLYDFISSHWEKSDYTEKCLRYFRSLKRCPDWMSKKQKYMFYLLRLSPGLFRVVYRIRDKK